MREIWTNIIALSLSNPITSKDKAHQRAPGTDSLALRQPTMKAVNNSHCTSAKDYLVSDVPAWRPDVSDVIYASWPHLRIHRCVLCTLTPFQETLWLSKQGCTIIPSDCTRDHVLLGSASRLYLSCISHPEASTTGPDFPSHLGLLGTSLFWIRHCP